MEKGDYALACSSSFALPVLAANQSLVYLRLGLQTVLREMVVSKTRQLVACSLMSMRKEVT